MNEGKIFENNFKKSIPSDVFYLRLKDSAASFGRDSVATRFALKNPYDALLFNGKFLFAFELKSTDGTSFSIQKEKSESSKMIKKHQIDGLNNASTYNNVRAGFILDFRNSNTWFISIADFLNFISNTEKKSINEKDVKAYNGIVIDKYKKKINYTYDIDKLLNSID